MREEKFKVIGYIRELIIYVDNNLENFPKADLEIKSRIRNISYDLLECVYEANTTSDSQHRLFEINKCIAKIKVLDFLINLSFDKHIINQKRYTKFGGYMDEIIKYLVGWKLSIK